MRIIPLRFISVRIVRPVRLLALLLLWVWLVCFVATINNRPLPQAAQASTPDSPSGFEPEGFRSEPLRQDALKKKGGKTSLSPVPPVIPETIPVPGQNAATTAVPPPKDARTPGLLRYTPYNTFPRELDIWNLEGKRFIRGPAVIAPDKRSFVYSEVVFTPYNRQTFSRLYRVIAVPPEVIPPEEEEPAPEDAQEPESPAQSAPSAASPDENADENVDEKKPDGEPDLPSVDPLPRTEAERFEPEKNLQRREVLLEVGYGKIKRFDFRTLTIVDWSATGRRLLIKEKSGVLHVGLRTSDIVISDEKAGTVTIYPEVRRIIQHYWRTKGNLPNINRLTWELTPLGWEPGSDSTVLLKGWALDSREKKFLGVWRYDVDTERAELLSLQNQPVPVAANGWLGEPLPDPKPPRRPPRKHTL